MCKRVVQGKRCAGIRSGDFRYNNIWCDKLCTILYIEHSLRYNLLSAREGKFVIYRSSLQPLSQFLVTIYIQTSEWIQVDPDLSYMWVAEWCCILQVRPDNGYIQFEHELTFGRVKKRGCNLSSPVLYWHLSPGMNSLSLRKWSGTKEQCD